MKKMKTILVPLDGSEMALHVIPYVRTLAAILPADVLLLHVISPAARRDFFDHAPINTIPLQYIAADEPVYLPDRALSVSAPSYTGNIPANIWEQEQQQYATLRQHAETYLNQAAEQLRKDGLEVDIDVHFDSPAERIVAAAHSQHATLIAMVTHGYSGMRRWAFGSVTDEVVHKTDIPVFIVRDGNRAMPNERPTIQRILVPLDGTECARQALPIATELATCADARIRLVRAINPIDDMPIMMNMLHAPGSYLETLLADIRSQARDTLKATAGELRQCHLQVSTCVSEAHPAELIVGEAARWQSDLIVMATHGYNGLKRLAMGSVADKVLHATTTPLLLVHAADTAS